MNLRVNAQHQGGSESTIIYETWFDFISEAPLFTEHPRKKRAEEEWFIRERTVVIEPVKRDGPKTVSYRGRSAFSTIPYFRADIISRIPVPFDVPDKWFVLGSEPLDGPMKTGEGGKLTILSFPELEENLHLSAGEKPRMIARYTENLHLVDVASLASRHDPRRLPVLYVRKAFPKDGNGPPDHIIFHVNVPLGVYHILPPPFEDRVMRVKDEKCKNRLLEERSRWHALVFKRSAGEEDFFDIDCEESLNVFPNFVRYLLPEGVWKLSLIVHRPKRGLIYGIHLPVPLTAFEP